MRTTCIASGALKRRISLVNYISPSLILDFSCICILYRNENRKFYLAGTVCMVPIAIIQLHSNALRRRRAFSFVSANRVSNSNQTELQKTKIESVLTFLFLDIDEFGSLALDLQWKWMYSVLWSIKRSTYIYVLKPIRLQLQFGTIRGSSIKFFNDLDALFKSAIETFCFSRRGWWAQIKCWSEWNYHDLWSSTWLNAMALNFNLQCKAVIFFKGLNSANA